MSENSTASILIGPGRMSFPALLKPEKLDTGEDGKFAVTLCLPPTFDTAPLLAALWDAWKAKFGSDPKKWPRGPTVRTPDSVIRECAEKPRWFGDLANEGWSFVTARSGNKPDVVDGTQAKGSDGKWVRVSDPREIYAGRWAIISVNAYAYQNKTTGVSLGLNNVMLRKHDTAFGGAAPRAETDFDGLAEDIPTEKEMAD